MTSFEEENDTSVRATDVMISDRKVRSIMDGFHVPVWLFPAEMWTVFLSYDPDHIYAIPLEVRPEVKQKYDKYNKGVNWQNVKEAERWLEKECAAGDIPQDRYVILLCFFHDLEDHAIYTT